MMRSHILGSAVGLSVIALLAAGAAGAVAGAAGHIDHVESRGGTVRVLFSIGGLPESTPADLSTLVVTIDGRAVDAKATSVSERSRLVRRTAILVIDASESMAGKRFAAAKAAALSFVSQAPADVKIGLVTFADAAETVQAPTTDRDALRTTVSSLELSRETHLYDGVLAAIATAGRDGQRSVLVLTDGHDTTGTALAMVTDAVRKSGDKVDVVGLSVSPTDSDFLSRIAAAGGGALIQASDPTALGALFRDEANDLGNQVLVSFAVPPAKADTDATLVVSLSAGGATYTDDAFVNIGPVRKLPSKAPSIPVAGTPSKSESNAALMIGGIGFLGLAFLLVAATLLGVFRREARVTPAEMLAGYGGLGQQPKAAPTTVSVKSSAIDLTARAIARGGLENKLTLKLDAAGIALKPAEWVLLQAGLAGASALLGFLLFGGNLIVSLLLLPVGAGLPWFYLGFSASRRIRAFNAQLPDALQLIAGGLRAGLSLPQALDTIVKEGTEPMAGEFRRALVAARLGMGIEDALDLVAVRMESKDFEWVVMAIRVQREVGGNLAELILTVAATLREREYLRRQVRALSAEGRLSAWILCLMPMVFLAYLQLTNADALRPMFHTGGGLMLLSAAAVLMLVGSFWMSKAVQVEA